VRIFQPDRRKNATLFSVVAACAVETAVVYENVLVHGLDSVCELPESTLYNSVLCILVADINWDGCFEVLLGTYGQVRERLLGVFWVGEKHK
jgi:hypothetical protein